MGSRNLVFYRFWVVYFLVTIAIVGFSAAYLVATPFWLVGFLVPASRCLGGAILCRGIQFLLWIQPWLNADVKWGEVKPGLTVANHRSTLDAYYILSRIQNVRLICKQSLFLIPGLNLIMVMMRQIGIRRGSLNSYMKAMERLRAALRAGETVHVFPEMTRCEFGFAGTQEFHLAPFLVAVQEKIPVTPIVFINTDRVWRKGRFGISYREPVEILTLPPIDAGTFTKAQDLVDTIKAQINAQLARVVAKTHPVNPSTAKNYAKVAEAFST